MHEILQLSSFIAVKFAVHQVVAKYVKLESVKFSLLNTFDFAAPRDLASPLSTLYPRSKI